MFYCMKCHRILDHTYSAFTLKTGYRRVENQDVPLGRCVPCEVVTHGEDVDNSEMLQVG